MRELLSKLRAADIHLELINDKLNIRFPRNEKLDDDLLEEIRTNKSSLIYYLSNLNKPSFSIISRIDEESSYALSSSQRRLWILSQFTEANIAYNMPGAYVFEGVLDSTALSAAFSSLLERHEILRTVFRPDEQDEVRQYIIPSPFPGAGISYHDLRGDAGGAEQVRTAVNDDFILPFDLSGGPLIRAGLYQLTEDRFVFTYVMHHIISDGWSMDILIRELLQLYNAYSRGADNPLSPLRIQYRDYAFWQQQQLGGESLQAHRDYWLKQFEGELPILELPASHPRPSLKTYNGQTIYRSIGPEVLTSLKELSQDYGGTLFMGLLSAVKILLYRYTGQGDLIIGTPMAGREHADLEDQIGFYVNTLALRSRLKGSFSYHEVFDQVKEVTMDAYTHQIYPFDQLVEELNLRRDMSRNPLFDVSIVLQNTGQDAHAVPELEKMKISRYKEDDTVISKFDLTFNFSETEGVLCLAMEYNTDIYEQEMMEGLSVHFEGLLSAIIAAPEQAAAKLDYLSTEEKDLLLNGFNNTAAVYPQELTIVDLFAEQAIKNADVIAVISGQERLTYRELDERSNQFGAYLISQYHVCTGELIGIMLERSEWLIVVILGVLKSGAVYVPIDPEYPQERINYIFSDSGCKAIIDEATIVDFKQNVQQYDKTGLQVVIDPVQLAYVIYTSGSTGQPKGVMIEHGSLVNRLDWMWKALDFSTKDIILQKTTFTFDVSVWELFMPLCWGAGMVMCEKEDIGSPDRILSLIVKHRISCLHFVPGMMNAFMGSLFVEGFDASLLQSLRCVVTSGEALSVSIVASWYAVTPVPVYNLYGPTEASIDVTFYRTAKGDNIVPIGRPIANTQIYILSAEDQLQPVGVSGEICIGGVGLARGYLNNPSLTAEKFVAHPFIAGERIYRTGDIGRWLLDGNVEYSGRVDDQVKIRGYRIELGEIEQCLLKYDGITSAVVVTRKGHDGNNELLAYVVSNQLQESSSLMNYLSAHLPGYMVPSQYLQLESLPLTGSGKVDKKALKEMKGLELETGTDYLAARNQTEEQLVSVWEEVLGHKKIGVRDNFFELGGDSIKTIQIVSKLKQSGLSLTVQDILLNPVIENLVPKIKKTENIDYEKAVGDVKLSPVQQLFFKSDFNEKHHFNQSVLLYTEETLSFEGLKESLDAIYSHHPSLRMLYKRVSGNWVQEIQDRDLNCSVEVIEEIDVHKIVLNCESVQAGMDLENGPLFKVVLFQTKAGSRILLAAHHLIIDGVSWRVLLEDLSIAYSQFISGQQIKLPVQTASFKTWQEELLIYSESRQLAKEHDYWLSISSQVVPLLPLDKPGGRNLMEDTSSHSFYLNEKETETILTKCYRTYHTDINDILLTALSLALNLTFRVNKILIQLEGHGRENIDTPVDISRTIGWFTTKYPVLIKLNTIDAVKQLIEVKETLHRVPNKGLGFGVLSYLTGKNYTVRPEIQFNYLGDFDTSINSEHQLFKISDTSRGKEISDRMPREVLLDVTAIILNNRLNVSILYSVNQYSESTIASLLSTFKQQLLSLTELLSLTKEVQQTPVDFTYKGLSINQLEQLKKSL